MDFALSQAQCANLIINNGANKTYMIEGGTGTGKTAIQLALEAKFGDTYEYVTVDCTQWDVGDVQIPDADKVNAVMRFLPNVMLIGETGKPMCILADEFGKASRPVQNAFLPVLLERRVGCRKLPAGSIVYGTTNLGAEGLGDLMQPHARNRVSFIEMRAPNADEWIEWGIEHNVAPAMLAFANEFQQIFQQFKDVKSPADNPYIFHPKEQRRAFCTPRSLYLASLELDENTRTAVNDEHATMAAVAGNIGMRAAADLMAFVKLSDKTPRYKEIVADPHVARMFTESSSAMCMTVYSCVARVTKEELDAVITYVERMPKELQALFARQLTRSNSKKVFAVRNRKFTEWCSENSWLLT